MICTAVEYTRAQKRIVEAYNARSPSEKRSDYWDDPTSVRL
jgi:hypothetical protein